tara:strand:- start:4274 stop:5044 length:771 start_codon:yes stop_codon:yes gene_type:complete
MKTLNKEYLNSRLSFLMKTPEERRLLQSNLTVENEHKLLSLKDIHKGKRCFIVGSSPSVKNLDLSLLNDEFTFTVNRGYKLIDSGLNNSTYHLMSDIYTLEDEGVRNEFPQNFSNTFLTYAGIDFPFDKNVIYFDYTLNTNKVNPKINECIKKPFIECSTIIAYALQFAYFMGFDEINIIGVDLDFNKVSGHAYNETSGEKARQKDSSIKDSDVMLNGLTNISEQLIEKGVKVQNASPVGVFNSIPRINYNELFKG